MSNYAFDLDNTLTPILTNYIFYKYNMKPYPPINWKMTNYPECIRQDMFSHFRSEKMIHSEVYPKAKELINQLKEDGNNVIIVTARDKIIEESTIKIVKELFGVECIVSGMGEKKLPILLDYNIDIWVDDSPNELLEIEESGIKCFMISNDETVYNWYLRDKILNIKNIEEFYFLYLKYIGIIP